jgi:hypothetical protein
MTNKLYFIAEGGTYQEVPPSDYGALEYGSPTLAFMYAKLNCDTVEHLTVVYEGKPMHLFFDEEGLASPKRPNDRASALAGNRHLRGQRMQKFRYDDLTKTPPPAIATLLATGMLIVGDALLWTGEME